MSSNEQIPVLIIGGGIVGLAASLFLTHHSIPSVLIERHAGTSIHPRARSVNARTMELFRTLGIESRVREAGVSMSQTMGMYSGHSLREVIESHPRSGGDRKFPFAGLVEGVGPAKGAWVTQDMLEPVLLDIARQRGGELRFNTECVSVEQDGQGVTASLKDRESKEISTVRAKYLIAADGASSPIRTSLNVPTTGRGTMGHLLNILFHADLESLVQGREFSLCKIEHPEVHGLFASINNSDRWVFQLSYDPSKGEKVSDFTKEKCRDLLRLALGISEIAIDIKSILPWEPTVRVVEKLQHGRIFLAGDAAHQMPLWAGQGANSGIADVHNLAWKLAAVLKGYANERILETYDPERLPVDQAAAETSANAAGERGLIETKKSLRMLWGLLRRVRVLSGHGYTYTSGGICEEDFGLFGGVSWRPWTVPSLGLAIDGRSGGRLPHVWVELHGKRISSLDLCGKGFVLLAGQEGGVWVEAAQKMSSLTGADITAYCVGPNGDVVCEIGKFEGAAGISSQGAILVRPDDFVMWRQRRLVSDSQGELKKAMKTVVSDLM